MNSIEKMASIVGGVLVGLAAYLAVAGLKAQRTRAARKAPVERLAHQLEEAWSGYHNR